MESDWVYKLLLSSSGEVSRLRNHRRRISVPEPEDRGYCSFYDDARGGALIGQPGQGTVLMEAGSESD